MEVLILVLFYYLSQNADFAESVKPLMNQIKDSEHMLRFLNDLSKFSETFSTFNISNPDGQTKKEEPFTSQPKKEQPSTPPPKKEEPKSEEKENPQSPTSGIADEFIQSILESYLKKT